MGRSQINQNNSRKQSQIVILIICEGETEVAYFEGFRKKLDRNLQSKIAIKPKKAKRNQARELVIDAIGVFKQKTFNHICIIFDNDNQENKRPGSLQNAFAKLRDYSNQHQNHDTLADQQIRFVYTSVCWEQWVLWHFENTHSIHGDCDSVINIIKQKHWPQYEKNQDVPYWEVLLPKLKNAEENAKQARLKAQQNNFELHQANPWSNVDVMLRWLCQKLNIAPEEYFK